MTARTYADWASTADADWLALWGKAQPPDEHSEPAHPVVCHMIDVASVAHVLLTERLPRALAQRLLAPLGGPDAVGLLCFIVALHDMGKPSPAFVQKVPDARVWFETRGFDFPVTAKLPHGEVSVWAGTEVLLRLGVDVDTAWRLSRAVGAHHGQFPKDRTLDDLENDSVPPHEGGYKPAWRTARAALANALQQLFGVPARVQIARQSVRDHAWIMLLAGLTSVADWLGSMAEVFVYEPPPSDLKAYQQRSLARARVALDRVGIHALATVHEATFARLFPGYQPWPLHTAVEGLGAQLRAPSLLVVEAPMGEGKTEAALLAAELSASQRGTGGFYLGLPTQATANQLLDRAAKFLTENHAGVSNLQLAHGEKTANETFNRLLSGIYDPNDPSNQSGSVRAERWFLSSKRTLLADFGVGTIDQALLGVLRTQHVFVRLFGLAGKTVIFDEVHAYDTYTSTLIDRLVAWLGAMGVSVVILSATLPRARRDAIVRAYLGDPSLAFDTVAYPRITAATIDGTARTASVVPVAPKAAARTVAFQCVARDENAVVERLCELVRDGGCVASIMNTVARSQTVMRALLAAREDGRLPQDTELLLIHARFPLEERLQREGRLKTLLGPKGERPARCIVVGTQVLEQSLDVDFDVMLTDLAPVDLLLQRAGRVHRHQRPSAHAPRERSAAHPQARVEVSVPDGDPEEASTSGIAFVYEPFVVRRTWALLSARTSIAIPTEIESLVEGVYGWAPDASTADTLRGEYELFVREREDDKQSAQHRRLPDPQSREDIFGDLEMPFDPDREEEAYDKALAAETRLGEPSVSLLCVFGRDGKLYRDRALTVPIDTTTRPRREEVTALLGRGLNVQHKSVVWGLKDVSVPAAWKDVPLLADRKLVVFENDAATVDNVELRIDPALGLVISRKESGNS